MNSTHNKGQGFEQLVGELYRKVGYTVTYNVRQPLPKKHRVKGNEFNEFDLVMTRGIWLTKSKVIVECKYRSAGKVSPEEVSWFTAKLQLHGVKTKNARMVTNASYQASAHIYAHDVGLELIDGRGLQDLYRKTLTWRQKLAKDNSSTHLEKMIMKYCL